MKAELVNGSRIGLVAVASTAAIEAVHSTIIHGKVPSLPNRLISRIVIGGLAVYGSEKLKAPAYVSEGIVAGVVAMSIADIAVTTMVTKTIGPALSSSVASRITGGSQ